MRIDRDRCTACGTCVAYCPVGAIATTPGRVTIDENRCVECSVCLRAGVCEPIAIVQPPLAWPRVLRAQFSDPFVFHPATGIKGRGTAEVKTNDVSGRYRPGTAGLIVELGRPGVSASLRDVELVTTAIAGLVRFEERNPLTALLDGRTGRFLDRRVLDERVLSVAVECGLAEERLDEVLARLREVSAFLPTVASVAVVWPEPARRREVEERAAVRGWTARCNGKVNVGLGRPLA
jgi:NAD-dependent dihydropyrimidine dehydrogenase PreA subunit